MLDEKRDYQQERQNDAADPQNHGSPEHLNGLVVEKLKEEHTGAHKDRAGEKKSGAKNQRDAILIALEADEGNGSENQREQPGDDLQITLKNGVGIKKESPQPHGDKKDG